MMKRSTRAHRGLAICRRAGEVAPQRPPQKLRLHGLSPTPCGQQRKRSNHIHPRFRLSAIPEHLIHRDRTHHHHTHTHTHPQPQTARRSFAPATVHHQDDAAQRAASAAVSVSAGAPASISLVRRFFWSSGVHCACQRLRGTERTFLACASQAPGGEGKQQGQSQQADRHRWNLRLQPLPPPTGHRTALLSAPSPCRAVNIITTRTAPARRHCSTRGAS